MQIDCGNGIVILLTGQLDRARVKRDSDGLGIADVKTGGAAVSQGVAKTKGHAPQIGTYELLYEHTTGERITAPAEIIGLKTKGAPEVGTGEIIERMEREGVVTAADSNGGREVLDAAVVDAEFEEIKAIGVERFAGHTLGEIAIGAATKKDVFDLGWLQSRFALTSDEGERVILQLLDQGVIVLEAENADDRKLNTYRIVKKPGEIALDLE
ncbi:PD-(D/E)XK nuclease family protein [Pseudomonas sp. LRF_L74]|uniref:PD-(D/E)XK nuclease family protein n=1 Tax=Pseudomonas sp. LRF_L74 TaxID=3369422 RepID=UPI003F61BFF5